MHARVRLAVVLLGLVPWLPAQQVWIVDLAGGAGSHFRAIQPALDVARDGDIVLVRRGDYDAAVLTARAGVSLIGETGARVAPRVGAAAWLDVSGLGAGRRFVLAGFQDDRLAVTLADNAGEIVLDGLRLLDPAGSTLWITRCRAVFLRDVELFGQVQCIDARGVFQRCLWSGLPAHIHGHPPLFASASRLAIVDSSLTGGYGVLFAGTGIQAVDCELALTGSTVIAAGSAQSMLQAASAVAASGLVEIDPAVTLVPNPGAPPISGSATIQPGPIPSCSLVRNGSSAVLALRAPAGSPFCLVVSPLSAGPSPFGWLWVDLAAAASVASAATGSGGFAIGFALPPLPLASVFAAQAAVLLPSGLAISEPAALVVR